MVNLIENQPLAVSNGARLASEANAAIPAGAVTQVGTNDSRDVVTLSPRARVLRDQMCKEQIDFADHVRVEARHISESQGLEPGHYDFRRLTNSQLEIVVNDIMLNEGDPNPEATFGLRLALSADGTGFGSNNTPVNYLNALQNMRDERKYRHDAAGADRFEQSLIFLNDRHTAAKAGS